MVKSILNHKQLRSLIEMKPYKSKSTLDKETILIAEREEVYKGPQRSFSDRSKKTVK